MHVLQVRNIQLILGTLVPFLNNLVAAQLSPPLLKQKFYFFQV